MNTQYIYFLTHSHTHRWSSSFSDSVIKNIQNIFKYATKHRAEFLFSVSSCTEQTDTVLVYCCSESLGTISQYLVTSPLQISQLVNILSSSSRVEVDRTLNAEAFAALNAAACQQAESIIIKTYGCLYYNRGSDLDLIYFVLQRSCLQRNMTWFVTVNVSCVYVSDSNALSFI